MNAMLEQLQRLRIVPVIACKDAAQAAPLAAALEAGGLPCAEVTLRTPAALAVIRTMAQRPGLLVGAGTVLKPEQAQAAVDAGARFIVAPGFNPKVVRYCVERQIPIFPGVCTPTEIEMALDHGLEVVKFFPAEAYGGVKTLQALCAPYGGVRFIPTGGITAANLAAYLRLPAVVACGGSWMVAGALLDAGRFDEVERLSREAVALAASVAVP